jgi:hypothetical protein
VSNQAGNARASRLGPSRRAWPLAADLADLARSRDRNDDGGSIAIPASYLETILTLR